MPRGKTSVFNLQFVILKNNTLRVLKNTYMGSHCLKVTKMPDVY